MALQESDDAYEARLRRAQRKLAGSLDAAGWTRSITERRPQTQQGQPLPLYTYSAVRFLEARTKPDWRVFEYGSGMSTLWWARRVQQVVACEHQEQWFDEIGSKLPENVDYRLVPYQAKGDAYCQAILLTEYQFQVIVIDGRDRINCAGHAVEKLTPDGVIVWDNADRGRYAGGIRRLLRQGFRTLPFDGLLVGLPRFGRTTVFYRDGNCLGI